jgi:hypothetical protein
MALLPVNAPGSLASIWKKLIDLHYVCFTELT